METVKTSALKPVVIGLYGVPGAGKIHLLRQLKAELGEDHFLWCEGSERLDKLVEGGLEAFKSSSETRKQSWREACINKIGQECKEQGRVGVVTGHFSFSDSDHNSNVWTSADSDTYTHILYLDTPRSVIFRRHTKDEVEGRRARSAVTELELQEWQESEKDALQKLYAAKDIKFQVISGSNPFRAVLGSIAYHVNDSTFNTSRALAELDRSMAATTKQGQLQKMLVFDADRTLTAQDTGKIFWEWRGKPDSLKKIFSKPTGYSYECFRAMWALYDY